MKELKLDDKVVCLVEEHIAEVFFGLAEQLPGRIDAYNMAVRPDQKFWQARPGDPTIARIVGEFTTVNIEMRFYRSVQ